MQCRVRRRGRGDGRVGGGDGNTIVEPRRPPRLGPVELSARSEEKWKAGREEAEKKGGDKIRQTLYTHTCTLYTQVYTLILP